MMIRLCLVSLWLTAFPAMGAKLFDSTDYVSAAQEAAEMDANVAKNLRHTRAQIPEQIKGIQVTRIHRASLGSKVITLQTPDGEQRQYVKNPPIYRPPQPEGLQMNLWHGTSKSHGTLTIVWTDDGKQFGGGIVDTGKYFRFDTLSGQKGLILITEINTNRPERETLIVLPRTK